MHFTPTTHGRGAGGGGGGLRSLVRLLVALQMVMTLDMPLSTTSALPVTSKPIEGTAENLAWQAWLMLPPEQKQLMKSRKVTPKSIFTLPLKVECPEGHHQVDSKCIPTAIGSNAVLIDPSVLSLVLGNPPADVVYDYEDEAEEETKTGPVAAPYVPPLYVSGPMETVKSTDDTVLEQKPPTKDEPLKFNIFSSKFPTDDYPVEDYIAMSNEGMHLQETSNGISSNASLQTMNQTNTTATSANATANQQLDLTSEPSNISAVQTLSSIPAQSAHFSLDDIDAISLPASAHREEKPQKVSLFKDEASIHLVTATVDTETAAAEEQENVSPNDFGALLQTESLMPMMSQMLIMGINEKPDGFSSSSAPQPDDEKSPDLAFTTLNVGEEMTTITPNVEEELETLGAEDKVEYIRSATLISDEVSSDEITTITPGIDDDEPAETTMKSPDMQLDETTVRKINGEEPTTTLATLDETTNKPETVTTLQPEAEEYSTTMLMQQEQALKDFQELQRMRNDQSDQGLAALKKSKVQPVEVLANPTTTTTDATPDETTTSPDELITDAEAVTPLPAARTGDKSDDNNDRFYYQHFAKQDLGRLADATGSTRRKTQQQQQPPPPQAPQSNESATAKVEALATTPATTVATAETSTSEIDLAQELRLINDLVKGRRSNARVKSPSTLRGTTSPPVTAGEEALTSTPASKASESSVSATATLPNAQTTEMWSKIMPLINTSPPKAATPTPVTAADTTRESSTETLRAGGEAATSSSSTTPPAVVSNRSHRNSKIIRISGLNTIHATTPDVTFTSAATTTPVPIASTATATTTTTTTTTTSSPPTDDASSSSITNDISSSSEASYEPFWWLPVAWRVDPSSDPTTTTTPQPPEDDSSSGAELPLLLRFWSAYHAPRSS